MDSFNKLAEYFRQFPGIGPRQAKRFVYFLLSQNQSFLNDLSGELRTLKSEVVQCSSCFRFFLKNKSNGKVCSICADASRDKSLLMIVSRDADLDVIEKSDAWNGLYFVLGGSIPILDKNPDERIRTSELVKTVAERAEKTGLKEIVFALNATPEGENTYYHLEKTLRPLKEKFKFSFSTLGRGLSTGTELEYSDTETIKNALAGKRNA